MIRWPYMWRKKEGCPFRIPHLAGAIYLWDCLVENWYMKHEKLPETGINESESRAEKVIVSLTTFPKRLDQCFYAIKSLMIQSYKADRIILWIADSQFTSIDISELYKELITRGLEIRRCDDLRSHKKYFYCLQEQKPNELVITYDDDIIYDYHSIERLVKAHTKYTDCVICNRGHHILVNQDKIEKYKKWRICSSEGVNKPSLFIMPSTGAGCLYPYNVMPETTFQKDMMMQNAFTADDIWMCMNRIHAGVKVVKTMEKVPILCNVFGSQEEALTQINDLQGENEMTCERLYRLFPDVVEKLKNEYSL